MSEGEIDRIFSMRISRIMRFSEGVLSKQRDWCFYREVVLHELNELRRSILEHLRAKGVGNGAGMRGECASRSEGGRS